MTLLINIRCADESVITGVSRAARAPAQVAPDCPGAHRHGTYTPWLRTMVERLGIEPCRAPGQALPLPNDRRGVTAPLPRLYPLNSADARARPVTPRSAEMAIETLLSDDRLWAALASSAIERAAMWAAERSRAATLDCGGGIRV